MRAVLGATFAVCIVLSPAAPVGAATDATTRAACVRLEHAKTGSSIHIETVQAAAGQLARSSAVGSRSVAQDLEAGLRKLPPDPAAALRRAQAWCDRHVDDTSVGAPSTTAGPDVVPQHFDGTGNAQVALDRRTDGVAVVRIAARGSQSFSLRALAADGKPLSTLVDAGNSYVGTRPLNLEAGPTTARLDVAATGTWSIDVVPLDQSPRVPAPGHAEGTGDEVLIVGGTPTHAHFEASAPSGRFTVDGYGLFKAPLVDEPSPYSGTVVTPTEARSVLEIRADGPWSIELS